MMRSIDWAATPLGPAEAWSPTLRTMVGFLLANRFPLLLWWGPEFCQLYNDAYRPVLGSKHPALGQPGRDCWPEIWPIIGPLAETPFAGGPATWMDDIELGINRHGFVEETHFTFAYSPVPDDAAPRGIGGVLATVHEITAKVVGERRVIALRDLGAGAGEAKSAEDACAAAAATLGPHAKDVPFALLYLVDHDRAQARLAGSAGIQPDRPASPAVVSLDADAGAGWPLAECLRRDAMVVVEDLAARFPEVPAGPWPEPPHRAVVVPVRAQKADQLAGFLVAGISARLAFDELYRSFLELAAAQVASAVATARAYEEERRRAEALAELDRAKTAFFSNVSHEFRTPLTLMLGPLEDLMAAGPDHRGALALVHRNGQRLLRLVNTLLDFSRIEAGRVQASYEPVDLAELTTELASVFRAATDRAHLALVVDCPPLPEPVWVDRDMWEKVVLNLISNAFKFTLEGGIAVRLGASDGHAVLTVADTGIGIPQSEMPHLFDRFHRVAGARGRTHEGTGIGLALVLELVKLHGGTVSADSAYGRGSVFTVRIPCGTAHLPPGRVQAERRLASTAIGAQPFLQEALRWLPDARPASPPDIESESALEPLRVAEPKSRRAAILVADDNADMRAYLERLLAPLHDVRTVANGAAALAALRERRADLLLSDVMMPQLDGFDLLRAVRADPALADIPIILVSARAGEEASIEGLAAGADDYLVKPFSARELIARVSAALKVSRLRRDFEARTQADLDAMTRLLEIANLCVRADADRDSCLRQILAAAIDLTGAAKGNIQLVDPASGSLVIAVAQGFDARFLDFFGTVRTGEASSCGAALPAAARVTVPDITQSDVFARQPSLAVMLEAGVRAVCSTPLLSSTGKTLGMVSVHFGEPHAPSDRELRLLDLLVRYAADFLERRKAETALRELNTYLEQRVDERTVEVREAMRRSADSERQLRLLIQAVTDYALIMLDRDGIVTTWNPGAERIKGYRADEIIGQHFSRFYTEEDRAHDMPRRALAIAAAEGRFEMEAWRVRKNGERFWANVVLDVVRDEAGTVIGFAKITRDMTERRQIQEQLQQSQKMEALGQLIAGVAHDFNNLLATILPSVEMARGYVDNELALRCLGQATHAVTRGAKLTRQLLNFSHNQDLVTRPIDVNKMVVELCEILPRTIGPTIEIKTRLDPRLWLAMSDPDQLELAIMNLAINARDSMALGGTITIATANLSVGDPRAPRGLEPQDCIMISVSDTGIGMTEEVRARAFEPFFTTKARDRGTGLGLSMVYSLARRSGGDTIIDSQAGRGTTVRVVLPRARLTTRVLEPATDARHVDAGPPARILVVDDDDGVREITALMVRGFGHEVVESDSGQAALDLLAADPAFDALIVDLAMPNMHGAVFAVRARAVVPQVPVLFITGYTDPHWMREVSTERLLRKPFSAAELAERLRDMLSGVPRARRPIDPASLNRA